jgi:integrase
VSVHKRKAAGGVRYDVRLRGPDGRERSKTFRTRRDAEAYEREQLYKRDRGERTDPAAARERFADLAEHWFTSDPTKRPRTLHTDRGIVERHLMPALGSRPVGSITRDDVQRLVNGWARHAAPATVRRHHGVLRAIFNHAVARDAIGRSPCRGIKLPAVEPRERHQLTAVEVVGLIAATDPRYRAMVALAAETGLRFSECAALRVGRLALLGVRPSLTVAESLTEAGGKLHQGVPKTKAGRRTLALSEPLRDLMAAHLAAQSLSAADPGALVFTAPDGGPVRYANFRRRVWLPALAAAGLEGHALGFHDLRRLAITVMVASGVDVRTAQHRVGHADPRMLLGVYAQATTNADRSAAEAVAGFLAAPGRDGAAEAR